MKMVLKFTKLAIGVLLVATPVLTFAQTESIGSGTEVRGGKLPKKIETLVLHSGGEESDDCHLTGVAVNLTGHDKDSGYLVEGCFAGTAGGPLWVVQNGIKPVILLSTDGYRLSLKKQIHQGLRDVESLEPGDMSHGSSNNNGSTTTFAFNGKEYVYVPVKKNKRRSR